MPAISDELRFFFWIITGIATVGLGIFTFILQTNIGFNVRKLFGVKQLGPKPPKRSPWIWASYFLCLIVSIVGAAIASSAPNSASITPNSMTGDFRIAVASFYENGDSQQKNLGYDLADSVRLRLEQDLKEINPRLVITIWGPDRVKRNGIIKGNTTEQRAEQAEKIAETIDADMVIYGVVDIAADKWQVLPEFYISADNFYEAREIVGQNDLGTPIDLPASSNTAWRYEFGKQMFARGKALSIMSVGLGYLALHQYNDALEVFQSGLNITGWNDDQGKKVLYLMTGFAAGKVGELDAQQKILDKAQINFDLADQMMKEASLIDSEYARPYIGLANLSYMRAIQPFNASQKREDIDIRRIEECYQYLDKAELAKNKPPMADAETKIHFARGQCLMMDVYSGNTTDLKPAVEEFQQVIQDFGNGTNPRIQDLAAEAHGRLALIYRWIGETDKAIKEYDIAASLLSNYPDRRKVFIEHKQDILNITPMP